jgi:hypothetical protein
VATERTVGGGVRGEGEDLQTFQASTLRVWASRLKSKANTNAPAPKEPVTEALRLLPVHVRGGRRDLEVRVRDIVIAVPDDVDVRRVAELVHALREASS